MRWNLTRRVAGIALLVVLAFLKACWAIVCIEFLIGKKVN